MKVVFLFLFLISGVCYAQIIPKEPVTGTKFFAGKPQHQPPDIINDYTEVSFYNICDNSFIVTNDSAFKIGDTVLLIQMKGALIDTSNTSNFGKILDYRNAGNYEFNYISQKAGNQLTFKNRLTKTYDIPDGVVQLVRIPYYKDGLFFNGLTCLPWDGSKGGVLALTVLHGIKTFGPIDVGGTGFKGGEGYNSTVNGLNCFSNNYIILSPANSQGLKEKALLNFRKIYLKEKEVLLPEAVAD